MTSSIFLKQDNNIFHTLYVAKPNSSPKKDVFFFKLDNIQQNAAVRWFLSRLLKRRNLSPWITRLFDGDSSLVPSNTAVLPLAKLSSVYTTGVQRDASPVKPGRQPEEHHFHVWASLPLTAHTTLVIRLIQVSFERTKIGNWKK